MKSNQKKAWQDSKLRIPLTAFGVLGVGLGASALVAPTVASADTPSTYQATLNPLNHVAPGATGTFSLSLSGSDATITEHVTGLAAVFNNAPYPHVQHIHINGMGQCPTPAADTNGDGVISTTEGQPAYGPIGTSLTTTGDTSPAAGTSLTTMPSGASFDYSRTITLDAASLASVKAGTAVIVVHGLDPSTLSAAAQAAKSDLVPSLPLAATSPVLCGTLTASQTSAVPTGGASTGGGSTANSQDLSLVVFAGALLLGGGGILAARRVRGTRTQS